MLWQTEKIHCFLWQSPTKTNRNTFQLTICINARSNLLSRVTRRVLSPTIKINRPWCKEYTRKTPCQHLFWVSTFDFRKTNRRFDFLEQQQMVLNVSTILQHSHASATSQQSALISVAASSVPPWIPSRRRRCSRRSLRPLHVPARCRRWRSFLSVRRSFETERGGQSFILKGGQCVFFLNLGV